MNVKKGIALFFIALAYCFTMGGEFFSAFSISASADENVSGYSDVISDLEGDESFSVEKHPASESDYSLEIIRLAESSDGELFVYVYQPAGLDLAWSINICRSALPNISDGYAVKFLELVDSDGVFFKYIVADVTVKDDVLRYYNISSISRPYVEADEDYSEHSTSERKSFSVAQLWTFCTFNDSVQCKVERQEVITVTDKYVGYVEYDEGFNLFDTSYDKCHSFFIAFNTDIPMDKVINARVHYGIQDYVYNYDVYVSSSPTYNYGEKTYFDVYLKNTDTGQYVTSGWNGTTYEWNRINTISEFIESVDCENVYKEGAFQTSTVSKIDEEGINKLQGCEHVLRFLETEYWRTSSDVNVHEEKSIVSEVSILELTYMVGGETYTRGVVDNFEDSDDEPINDFDTSIGINPDILPDFTEVGEGLRIAIGLLLLLVLLWGLSVLFPATKFIFNAIGNIFSLVLNLLIVPFRLIGSLFKKDDKK